jgi:hypothetical protein
MGWMEDCHLARLSVVADLIRLSSATLEEVHTLRTTLQDKLGIEGCGQDRM